MAYISTSDKFGVESTHSIKPINNAGMEQLFKCEHCSKVFSRVVESDTLEIDELKEQKVIWCNYCSTTFCDLRKTIVVKSSEDVPQPESDSYSNQYKDIDLLNVPLRISTFEPTLHDDVNDKPSSDWVNIKTQNETTTSKKTHKCKVCGQKFGRSGTLKAHLRIHTGEKPYRCSLCNKDFSQAASLKRHTKLHTEDKPYTCDICLKTFCELWALKNHEKIHTGERPHKCDCCGKDFSNVGDLNRHLKIHTGDKKYRCEVCGMRFIHSQSLKSHFRTHTGEKPYKCNVCNRRFTELATLRKHVRIHTGERPFKCEVCEQTFNQMSNMKRHTAIHTNMSIKKEDLGGEGNSFMVYVPIDSKKKPGVQ